MKFKRWKKGYACGSKPLLMVDTIVESGEIQKL